MWNSPKHKLWQETLDGEPFTAEQVVSMTEEQRTAAVNQTWSNYAVSCFAALWESIHGKGSWEQNPFVWAVTFKVVDGEDAK